MKGERIKYNNIAQLPTNAKSVSRYASEIGITVAYVYKLYKQGKIKIVDFQGYNFVIN
jgi:hypothetical protein